MDIQKWNEAANRGDFEGARRALWGDTPNEEIEQRCQRVLTNPVAMFADDQQAESGDIPVVVRPAHISAAGLAAAMGHWPLVGMLTTDHAASSYGQYVLAVDGVVYGRGDNPYSPSVAYTLTHPNPAPVWRSREFAAALEAATAQGWPLIGQIW